MVVVADSATVVVPTYRRPGSLRRALDGLARQVDPGVAWDVLVVDNAPGRGDTQGIAGLVGGRARVVDETTAGSAAARNRGIAEVTAAVTVFLDDDVVPEPMWLRELLEPIVAAATDATGGRVVLDPTVDRPPWFDEGGLAGYLAAFEPPAVARDLAGHEFVVTSNAAFRTDLLRASGGFRPDLGPQPRNPMVNDDVLLTRRFMAAGGQMRYAPSAVVVHELPSDRMRPRYLLRRAYAQGRSDWLLEADELVSRRFRGARVPLGWAARELTRRAQEWRRPPAAAFHAMCDVARTVGSLREAAAAR